MIATSFLMCALEMAAAFAVCGGIAVAIVYGPDAIEAWWRSRR